MSLKARVGSVNKNAWVEAGVRFGLARIRVSDRVRDKSMDIVRAGAWSKSWVYKDKGRDQGIERV